MRVKINLKLNKRKRVPMEKRLTQEQLTKVVTEIEQLSQQRETELDREQVQQILQELNL